MSSQVVFVMKNQSVLSSVKFYQTFVMAEYVIVMWNFYSID